ncbi:unnamed protein product [Lactuca saligna]|uniref:Uncharacterized protein n=1 Tax=Lactuca saligna TaxID=75948 RepID=A0AA35V047_LACSI|nr:unnamed protein product [Lactuca saligna]
MWSNKGSSPYGYGSACFKNNLNRLEAFHHMHVSKKGEFVDHLVEYQYDVDVNASLQNPEFVTVIGDIIRSFKNQDNNEEKRMKMMQTHSISCFMLWMIGMSIKTSDGGRRKDKVRGYKGRDREKGDGGVGNRKEDDEWR